MERILFLSSLLLLSCSTNLGNFEVDVFDKASMQMKSILPVSYSIEKLKNPIQLNNFDLYTEAKGMLYLNGIWRDCVYDSSSYGYSHSLLNNYGIEYDYNSQSIIKLGDTSYFSDNSSIIKNVQNISENLKIGITYSDFSFQYQNITNVKRLSFPCMFNDSKVSIIDLKSLLPLYKTYYAKDKIGFNQVKIDKDSIFDIISLGFIKTKKKIYILVNYRTYQFNPSMAFIDAPGYSQLVILEYREPKFLFVGDFYLCSGGEGDDIVNVDYLTIISKEALINSTNKQKVI